MGEMGKCNEACQFQACKEVSVMEGPTLCLDSMILIEFLQHSTYMASTLVPDHLMLPRISALLVLRELGYP